MTYLAANRNRRSPTATAIVYAGVFLALLAALIYFFLPHLIPSLATSVAAPFWRTEFTVDSGSLRSMPALLAENESLKRKIDEDSVRLASVQALQTENGELKALMGRASTSPMVLAAVLIRPPFSGYDELIVDAGSDTGFQAGDEVFAAGDVPIGRIADVLGSTSKVRLYSSPGTTYEVMIGASHAPATATGKGGGQYEAEMPRDVKIAEGDPVIAPSIGTKLFGIVSSVVSDPTDPFEKVLFAPPVNVYSLRWVLVEKVNRKP